MSNLSAAPAPVTKLVDLGLRHHSAPRVGASHLVVERTEWTPTPPPAVAGEHSSSNWPKLQFTGPLTNRKIDEYAREGRYGPQAKILAQAKQRKLQLTRNGTIIRCQSGLKVGAESVCACESTAYMRYSYLPKAGYYCLACREAFRKARIKEIELERKVKESFQRRINEEYV